MLLTLYVLDSLFFATSKSKRVLMHAWRHMLLTLRFADSLYFATPKKWACLLNAFMPWYVAFLSWTLCFWGAQE